MMKFKLSFMIAAGMFAVVAALPAVASNSPLHSNTTLYDVTERGYLRCGVNVGIMGFSAIDQTGEWAGLDVDFCRAFAAAVLGDKNAVEFVPLSAEARFPALQAGEIDVLTRNTTRTFKRETGLGLDFAAVTYYDGQGFLAPKSLGITSLRDLKPGMRICFHTHTTTEINLANYAKTHNLDYKPVPFDSIEEAKTGLFLGRCDLFTTDRGALASIRATEAPNPEDYVILPDIISKEPLGAFVREGDTQWRNIVRWVILATIQAEEEGFTAANVESMKASPDPAVKTMLGALPGLGESLGLDDQWMYRVIRQVGNYGEIFARNLGPDTPVSLDRGLNALWPDGGLMYAPPMG